MGEGSQDGIGFVYPKHPRLVLLCVRSNRVRAALHFYYLYNLFGNVRDLQRSRVLINGMTYAEATLFSRRSREIFYYYCKGQFETDQ